MLIERPRMIAWTTTSQEVLAVITEPLHESAHHVGYTDYTRPPDTCAQHGDLQQTAWVRTRDDTHGCATTQTNGGGCAVSHTHTHKHIVPALASTTATVLRTNSVVPLTERSYKPHADTLRT